MGAYFPFLMRSESEEQVEGDGVSAIQHIIRFQQQPRSELEAKLLLKI
jgi:hypothetical protein